MRLAPVVVVLLAGCVGTSHEDRTFFQAEGVFDAAVEAGADVLHAGERPEARGSFYDRLPMQHPELDAAWQGRYALESIHWWGPPGHPTPTDATHEVVGHSWQGFLAGWNQVQVMPGQVPMQDVRTWYDRFLVNTTSLSHEERRAAADTLLSNCDIACTAPLPASLDGSQAWQRLGGLEAVTGQDDASRLIIIGDWWWTFSWDEATLIERGAAQETALHVRANDVGEFIWRSRATHSDEASWQKLDEALAPLGVATPEPDELVWTHREIMRDG